MYQACVGALATFGMFTEVEICCCKLKVCMDVHHFKLQVHRDKRQVYVHTNA